MTYILPTTADGAVIAVPVGETTGTLLVMHHGCTYRGIDRDTCVIKITDDGNHGGVLLFPAAPPVTSLTFEDCTIDADGISTFITMLAASYYALTRLVLRRVRLRGNHKNTIAFAVTAADGQPAVTWVLDDVIIEGDGRAIVVSGSTGEIGDVEIFGCSGGLIVNASGSECTIVQTGTFNRWAPYWQGPTGETVVPTAFDATGADVVSNVTADRSLYDVLRVLETVGAGTITAGVPSIAVQRFDRAETAAGVWGEFNASGQVTRWHRQNSWIPAITPADGTAITVLRPILGRAFSPPGEPTWTLTRLSLVTGDGSIPEGAAWRRVDGTEDVPTLGAVARFEIMRIGTNLAFDKRDVSVGAIQLNTPCVDCRFTEGGELHGDWSDQFTDRGLRTYIRGFRVSFGQDMGFTLTGTRTRVIECTSEKSGVCGFLLESDDRTAGYVADIALIDCSGGSGNMRHGYTDQEYTDAAIGAKAKFHAVRFTGTIGGSGDPGALDRNATLNPRAYVSRE